LKGNPAIREGSMAFRPHLAMSLALTFYDTQKKQKKARHEILFRSGLSDT
jgi:hypothetical protein